jgi:hypothetical protein
MAHLNVESLEAREVPAAVVLTAPVELDFTPPIGSNKGSFASDGLGTTWPVSAPKEANGIIAILIGLRSTDQGSDVAAAGRQSFVLPYIEQDNS